MYPLLKKNLLEVLKAVAPLIVASALLHTLLGGAQTGLLLQFFAGAALALVGMVLLFMGIEIGILPMGRYIGGELPRHRSLWLIAGAGFAVGFGTTVVSFVAAPGGVFRKAPALSTTWSIDTPSSRVCMRMRCVPPAAKRRITLCRSQ